ncbi:DUF547 domain-containing protein [Thermodesulfobacteriota bacterium]
MKPLWIISALFVLSLLSPLVPVSHAGQLTGLYDNYQKLLDAVVTGDASIGSFTLNVVDYESLSRDQGDPASFYDSIIASLKQVDPAGISGKQEKVAFWINAYNISAIKLILDHYPTDSIRSRKINWLKQPWNMKIIDIGGKAYSLGQIEHEILLGFFKEPMIHFAVVCASLSCPEINTQVYRGSTLEDQLREQARKFLNDRNKGLRIEKGAGAVYFSKIFKFDKKTFPNGARDAISLITDLIAQEDADYLISGKYTVKYLEYDWSINSLSRARR